MAGMTWFCQYHWKLAPELVSIMVISVGSSTTGSGVAVTTSTMGVPATMRVTSTSTSSFSLTTRVTSTVAGWQAASTRATIANRPTMVKNLLPRIFISSLNRS